MVNSLNGLTLAYMGDAYFELWIRRYLIEQKLTKVNDLHKEAIKYTSAVGQAKILDSIFSILLEEEIQVFKRGRNISSTHKPKNCDLATYHKSTGFEAIVGYLYLSKKEERLEELLKLGMAL